MPISAANRSIGSGRNCLEGRAAIRPSRGLRDYEPSDGTFSSTIVYWYSGNQLATEACYRATICNQMVISLPRCQTWVMHVYTMSYWIQQYQNLPSLILRNLRKPLQAIHSFRCFRTTDRSIAIKHFLVSTQSPQIKILVLGARKVLCGGKS